MKFNNLITNIIKTIAIACIIISIILFIQQDKEFLEPILFSLLALLNIFNGVKEVINNKKLLGVLFIVISILMLLVILLKVFK